MSLSISSDVPSLLRALDAIRNGRAYAALLLGGLAAGVVAAVAGYFSIRMQMWGMGSVGMLLAAVGFIVAALLFMVGISAAGTSLLDQARGIAQRPFTGLLFAGVAALGRLLLLFLALLLIYAVIWVGALIVLFLTKIPVLGPLLYLVVFPLVALVFGLFGFVVLFVVNPLAAPAIWDGSGVLQTLAKLAKVARLDLLKVVLSQSLLFLLLLFASSILFGVVFSGIGMTSALSALIIDIPRPMGVSDALYMLQGMSRSGGGHIAAAAVGSGLLIGAATMAVLLIAISGNCLIYLQFAADIDASDMEGALRQQAQKIKSKAEAAREQARQHTAAAQKSWQERQQQAATPNAVATVCSNCQSPVTADDVFCGSCGHKQPGHGG
ncbi:MAG: hypothetical protein COZ47_02655 [Lysobacterales bacterium CG_4_10_14_3_um_filter_64_11]|nr:MAG: hypothetical protein COZ47_02655 [Xanthomonadales bacterium CG_4_10_14_3_um_filter_64_11]